MSAPPPSGEPLDLDAINDETLLKSMWQQEEDTERRHQIRKRMYRVRHETLQQMERNDQMSFGSPGQAADETVKSCTSEKATKSQLLKDKLNIESGSDDLVSVNQTTTTTVTDEETSGSVTSSSTKIHKADEVTVEEEVLDIERENIIKALQKAGKTVKVMRSEIPVRQDGSLSPSMSPSMKRKVLSPKPSPISSPSMKRKNFNKPSKFDNSMSTEFSQLSSYLKDNSINREVVVDQGEEEMFDDFGNKVQMMVTTTKDKDKPEFTTRRKAMTTKVVDNVEDIDEILIGNPDHEIIDRDIKEETTKDGHIKIITETRRRPDGVEYTTKNVVRYSKIFDYGHPETINPCDKDELLETNTETDTDENGVHIRTETEKRRKCDGTVYVNKKSYKVKKVYDVEPSENDEIIDSKETEEKDEDGNITQMVTQTRKNSAGQEYTLKTRRLTLSSVAVQQGAPTMFNNDEVVDKKEKQAMDENGIEVTCVTETRVRKDGTKYTFDYITRSAKGLKASESDMKAMPMRNLGASNIKVSNEDELISTETKEDLQEDGSMVRTIIERRRATDGTQYLRHRSMRIPKIPEPKLTVGTVNDEVLQNDVEETEYNGTKIRSVTERRRSSLTGLQYTLRRMSKTYHKTRRPSTIPGDEVFDENVTEESGDDGTIIKTIIRRYQRKDGTIYTTHNIHKVFTAPTQVVIEDDGELVDQTMDQSETEDGLIIKTVTETYERSDGVQYIVERTEKCTKDSAMYTKDYQEQPAKLIAPSTEDVIVSQDVDETPDEEGLVRRIVTEERRRADGTNYTTKLTITVAPELVPDQETSYVVIKPEEGMEDTNLVPSMEDKLVFTRKREETDENGEKIPIVIETRESKTTGEKYNVTKRVFNTDVIITDKGEEVIKTNVKSTNVQGSRANRSATPSSHKTSPDKKVPVAKPEAKTTVEKVTPTEKSKTPKPATSRPAAKAKKEPVAVTIKTTTSTATMSSKSSIRGEKEKLTSIDSRAKKTVESSRSAVASRESPRKPRPVTETPSPARTSARTPVVKSPAKTPTKRPITDRTPSRGAAPTEAKASPTTTATSRSRPVTKASPSNGTPPGARNCCDKVHASDVKKTVKSTATKTSKPVSAPSKPATSSPTTRSETPRQRPNNILDGPRKANGKKSPAKVQPECTEKERKDPRVSVPPTPITETVKSAPVFTDPSKEPTIEDVTDDPNLPRHKIHRPSVVREPSKDFSEFVDMEKLVDTLDAIVTESSIAEDTEPKAQPTISEIMTDNTEEKKPEKKTGSVVDRFRKFDEKKEIKGRKLSLENKDSVSLKRSMFESAGKKNETSDFKTYRNKKEPTIDKTPASSISYEGRTPVEEPLIVPKHFEPLGDEEKEKLKTSLESPTEMSSPKLIMRLTSKDKESDDNVRLTSSTSSYNGSRRSSSIKEDVEVNFQKEDSPSRFITGRPIDQGVNTNKLKKIERSLSGKISYDDLEEARKNLPSYLKSIESVDDLAILEAMLEKAESYEERRVIRGQIRQAKKKVSSVSTTVSSHSKFISSKRPQTVDSSRTSTRSSKVTESATHTANESSTDDKTHKKDSEVNTTTEVSDSSSSRRVGSTRKVSTDRTASVSKKISKDESSKTLIDDDQPREIEENKPEGKRGITPSSKTVCGDSKSTTSRSTLVSRKSSATTKESETNESLETNLVETSESSKLNVEEKHNYQENGLDTKTSERRTSIDKTTSSRRTSIDKTTSSRRTSIDKTTSDRRNRLDKTTFDRKTNEKKTTSERRASVDKKSFKSVSERTSNEVNETSNSCEFNITKDSNKNSNTLVDKNMNNKVVDKNTSSKTDKTSTTKKTLDKSTSGRKIVEKNVSTRKTPDKKLTSSTPNSTSDEYSAPLRHQKGGPRPKAKAQTDVEKIVSPYGVGVTDDNGLPLFGLKALKRRKQQQQDDTSGTASPAPAETPAFEPTEKGGRPMFGLGAVTRRGSREAAATTTTATATATATATVTATSTTSTTDAKTTEVVKKKSVTERKTSVSEQESDSESSSGSSSGSSSSDEAEEPKVVLRHSPDSTTRRRSVKSEEEVIKRRSRPLKDIIQLHETKVKEEIAPVEDAVTEKPKKKLRESFEPSLDDAEPKEDRPTWDISSDLATREINIRNVISKHETISKEASDEVSRQEVTSKETTETERKDSKSLSGILKKTSVFSTTESTTASSNVTGSDDPADPLDGMTEEQIARLSEEFDRRAQEDGVIQGDCKSSKITTVTSDLQTSEPKRKTSYTEIKLSSSRRGSIKTSRSSQPTDDDLVNTTTKRKVSRVDISKDDRKTVNTSIILCKDTTSTKDIQSDVETKELETVRKVSAPNKDTRHNIKKTEIELVEKNSRRDTKTDSVRKASTPNKETHHNIKKTEVELVEKGSKRDTTTDSVRKVSTSSKETEHNIKKTQAELVEKDSKRDTKTHSTTTNSDVQCEKQNTKSDKKTLTDSSTTKDTLVKEVTETKEETKSLNTSVSKSSADIKLPKEEPLPAKDSRRSSVDVRSEKQNILENIEKEKIQATKKDTANNTMSSRNTKTATTTTTTKTVGHSKNGDVNITVTTKNTANTKTSSPRAKTQSTDKYSVSKKTVQQTETRKPTTTRAGESPKFKSPKPNDRNTKTAKNTISTTKKTAKESKDMLENVRKSSVKSTKTDKKYSVVDSTTLNTAANWRSSKVSDATEDAVMTVGGALIKRDEPDTKEKPKKNVKPIDEKETNTTDDTTYWIVDEYGVKRQVEKDATLSYTVDDYGHRHYVSDSTSESVTDRKGMTKTTDNKLTNETKERIDESADDSATYWMTDEYGIKRQVTKGEKLPSYTVDKYGHPHYVTDTDTTVDDESSRPTDSKIKTPTELKPAKSTDVGTGSSKDSTTYWIVDEYGIKRQVEKDTQLNYTVDKYGHRHYTSDSNTETKSSKHSTDEKKSSSITKTSINEDNTDSTMRWVTDDDGVRRQVKIDTNRPVDRYGRPTRVSTDKTSPGGKSKPVSKGPNTSGQNAPKETDDGTTYWITDEYGIRRQVEKDSTLSYTVDDYGHRHYVTDDCSTSKVKTVDSSVTKDNKVTTVTDEKNTTSKDDSTTYWMTDEYGIRRQVKKDEKLPSYTVDKYGHPHYVNETEPEKDGKHSNEPATVKPNTSEENVTDKPSNNTTYWIVDEYGIKRQVEKDAQLNYTVDKYGHRHYVSTNETSQNKTENVDVTNIKETSKTEENSDSTMRWITDDDGVRRQVKIDTNRPVDRYGRPTRSSTDKTAPGGKSKPVSKDLKPSVPDTPKEKDDGTTYWITDEYGIRRQVEKDSTLSYTVDDYGHRHYVSDTSSTSKVDTKEKSVTQDIKITKETEETNESSKDDSMTYWMTDEYGIRRQVTKDAKLPSYTVDKYGHPHYVTDPDTKNDSKSPSDAVTKNTKSENTSHNLKDNVNEKSGDSTTYWITDEYGIKRQVEKDSRLNYTVDKYGHRHYVSDKETTEKKTKNVDISTVTETTKTEDARDSTLRWVTGDDGVRRQVKVDTKRPVDRYGRSKKTSETKTAPQPKTKSVAEAPGKPSQNIPDEKDNGTTYWITDEYGIRRQVEKDATLNYTVDDYGHRHYITDTTSASKVDIVDSAKSVDIKITEEKNVKNVSTDDSTTYWITDEYGIRRQVEKDQKLPSYTVDKYGHPHYEPDVDISTKTTETNMNSSEAKSNKTIDSESKKAADDTTYWIVDEYGIKRQVEKDSKVNYTVDKYGHRHYTTDSKTDTKKSEDTIETTNVKTASTEVNEIDTTLRWVTGDDGVRRQVKIDSNRPVDRYGRPTRVSQDNTALKSKSKTVSKTPNASNQKSPGEKDDGTTYWITDEYGIRRQVDKDTTLNYTVDEYGHRHYVTDSTTKSTVKTSETEFNVTNDTNIVVTDARNENINKADDDNVTYWMTDEYGIRRQVTKDAKLPSYTVDQYGHPQYVSDHETTADTEKLKKTSITKNTKPSHIDDSKTKNPLDSLNDDDVTYWIVDEYGVKRQVKKDSVLNYTVDKYGHRHYVTDSENKSSNIKKETETKSTDTKNTTTRTSEVDSSLCWVTDENGIRKQVKREITRPVDRYGRRDTSNQKVKTTSGTNKSTISTDRKSTTVKDNVENAKDEVTYWITDEYGIKRQVQKDSTLNYTVDKYGHRHYITDESSKTATTTSTSHEKSIDIDIVEERDSSYCWITDENGVRKQVKRETKREPPITKKPILKKETNSDNKYWMTDSYGNRKLISADEKPKKNTKSYLSNTESSRNKSVTIKVEENGTPATPPAEPAYEGPTIWVTDRDGVRRRVPKPERRTSGTRRHHNVTEDKRVRNDDVLRRNDEVVVDDDLMSEYSFVSESDSSFFYATDPEGYQRKISKDLVEVAQLEDLSEFKDTSSMKQTNTKETYRSHNEKQSSDLYEMAYFLYDEGGNRTQVSKYEYERVMGES